MTKIGLVIEGGGMKCAYEAGVTDRFIDDNILFDYAVGVSAGSANLSSYLAGQRGRSRRFYVDHIKEPGYFGISSFLKTRNLFGLQYIYGTITNSGGSDPLDFDAMMSNHTDFEIVATDAETGKPAYFDKQGLRRDDYREIMASSAIPVVCRPVEIDGRYYYDGGISDAIPIQRALDAGCDKLVVLLSKNRDFVRQPEKHRAIYSFACRKWPQTVEAIDCRHIMYKQCQERMFELERQGRAFIFSASEPLTIGTYTMDKKANDEIYHLGISDYDKRRREFFEFLEE
ncbi:MAG: patatin-like phospholipase family protein [Anaerovoracaceae bacterium]|jgi:predicted patatin/cPLA2 family phospholipase